MYTYATYETASERLAELQRDAARQRAIRAAEKAQRRVEPAAEGQRADRPQEVSLFLAVKRGLAAVGARIAAL